VSNLPDGYTGTFVSRAICTHPDLSSTEKLVAGEVDGLTTAEGPCRASNAKFSMFGLSEARADVILRGLARKGVIVRLGFHRVFVERVVSPEYSRNPELSRRWINSIVGENNYSRVGENNYPKSEGRRKRLSRVGENNGRGWAKTTIEGRRKRLPEISSEISSEKSKEKASPSPSRERSIVSEPLSSPEEKPFAVATRKEEEEKTKQVHARKRKVRRRHDVTNRIVCSEDFPRLQPHFRFVGVAKEFEPAKAECAKRYPGGGDMRLRFFLAWLQIANEQAFKRNADRTVAEGRKFKASELPRRPSTPDPAADRRETLITFWHAKDPRIAAKSIAEYLSPWDEDVFNRTCSQKLKEIRECLP